MQKKREFIISVCIIVIIVSAAFAPAIKNDFVNWDDPAYVTENNYINHISFANIKALLTTSFVGTYQPVVNLTYLLEHHFFGLKASFYHATNILLHLINCIFVFWLVLLLDGDILVSLTTALLFGLHPLRVESVAWVSERKDVLYSFFFLWALINYCYYAENNSSKYYYRSLFLFLLSLGSKVMALTLPIVFFAVDYLLKRKTDKKIILEKAPFFILAFLFGLVTIFFQGKYISLGHGEPFVILRQIAAPFYGIIMYLYKTVFPVNLSLIYPYPPQNAGFYLACFISFILISIIIVTAVISRKFTRKLNFGFIFALITILPVLQFIPVGAAIMADRYTYISSIGIFYIAAVGFFYLYHMKYRYMLPQRAAQIIFLIGVMTALFVLTYNRTQVWKNSVTIFSDVIKKYPDTYIAYNNRADAYYAQGDQSQAISDYTKAIEINPNCAEAYYNLGDTYNKKGDLPQAISDYTKAIEINPNFAKAYYRLGNAYYVQGNLPQAISDYTKAIEINPNYAEAYYNRGAIYVKQSNLPQAISDYTRTIEINPKYEKAYNNRADTYYAKGNLPQAISDYTKAIEINPNYAEAYYNLGNAYYAQGNLPQAIFDYTKAIEINPSYAEAYNNRGNIYCAQGSLAQAISDYTRAIEINPKLADAYYNRSVAYFYKKEYDKSWAAVHEAESLGNKFDSVFIEKLKKASGRDK